ncbi:hypothetical protein KSF_091930 [Reticulibacter mediterranei]|uniref:Uncharacterized protein n=1 Tax=Reticulibacter mediterranei TaxID=2778369 RepID=A0A8J3N844_9CHLR|nr:hypothetical protein [Reticulibacter mediterranei]GHO99145.1 hypothetical protein KSF_091930 [Reticulibacter mediterranei]
MASHDALRLHGTSHTWGEDLALTYEGESPFVPTYLKLASAQRMELPDYEYALYDGATRWRLENGLEESILARLGDPLFQRSAEHYTSHAQTPFDHLTEYPAVIQQNNVAAIVFPLGASYYYHGYWIYREIFQRLVRTVLPERLIETNAPLSAEISVTRQIAGANHPARWMVHIINFSPNLRTPEHTEYYEDPIALHHIWLELAIPTSIARAYTAVDGETLSFATNERGVRVEVPRIDVSAVVVLEEA